MAQWLRLWIPNPGFLFSKPLGVSKVDLAFCPSVVDEMSTRTHRDLMIKSKLSPFSGSIALEQFKPTCKKGPWSFLKFFLCDDKQNIFSSSLCYLQQIRIQQLAFFILLYGLECIQFYFKMLINRHGRQTSSYMCIQMYVE